MVIGVSVLAFHFSARYLIESARRFTFAAWPLLSVACSDPVHDQLVASLGPEDPNVGPGPNHRPGQPCLACHGDLGPAKVAFTVGGTVYAIQGRPQPAPGAKVQIEDVDGHTTTIPANAVGNFFVTAAVFTPDYPIQMSVTPANGGPGARMFSASNREGSCATCHFNPPGPNSPGPVFLQYSFGLDAGTE